MPRLAVTILSLLLLGELAGAAEPPVTDWSMEIVEVTGKMTGPALWHLKKGDSEIWILGTVGPLPEKFAWNTAGVAQAIDGANGVLLPPQAKADIFDLIGMSWFILWHRDALSMQGDQKLEASLSPELRARFVAARTALKKDADEYEDDSPLLAGFKLLRDYLESAKLSPEEPEKTVAKIAHDKHVKVRRIAEYSAVPLIKEMMKLPPEAGLVCFENALHDYEVLSRHAAAAAEAWAVGDIAGMKAHYSSSLFQACVAQSKKFGEIDQRAVGDTLKAIHEALSKPGKSVMVIDIGWLFRSGAAADQLKAEGVTIEGPTGQ